MSKQPPDTKKKPTHLVGRTRRVKFNRGGLRFEQKWQAFALKDLTRENVEAILKETEVESRLVSEEEAQELLEEQTVPSGDVPISKAALLQEIAALKRENGELRARCENLEAQITAFVEAKHAKGDSLTGPPPAQKDQVTGNAPPLPLPTVGPSR